MRSASRSPFTAASVVAVAAGPGLAALFESAGAVVVPGGPGQRPSTGQLLEAPNHTGDQAQFCKHVKLNRYETLEEGSRAGEIRRRTDLQHRADAVLLVGAR